MPCHGHTTPPPRQEPHGFKLPSSVQFALTFDPHPVHADLPRQLLVYALKKCTVSELAAALGCSRRVARINRSRALSQLTAMEPQKRG